MALSSSIYLSSPLSLSAVMHNYVLIEARSRHWYPFYVTLILTYTFKLEALTMGC